MIGLYMFITYLVNLGMMIESFKKNIVTTEAWFVLLISPITCPIIIGIEIASKNDKS